MLRKVYLELTDKCNLDCKMCFRKSWNKAPVDVDEKHFGMVVSELRENPDIEEVVLGGLGEPLFSPLFSEAVYKLKEKTLTVTTNGTLLKEQAEAITEGISTVVVSIDGLSRAMNELRGVSFPDIIDGIKVVCKMRKEKNQRNPIIRFQTVLSAQNEEDLWGIIDLAADLGVQTCVFSHLIPQSKEDEKQILYKLHGNERTKTLFQKLRNYSFRRGVQLVLPNWELKTERQCAFVENGALYLTASLNVVPCYRLSHYGKEHVFGREKTIIPHSFGTFPDQSLQDIWNTEEYECFREMVYGNRYPSCIDCDLNSGCDLAARSELDCYGNSPACGDCLWSRKFVFCP